MNDLKVNNLEEEEEEERSEREPSDEEIKLKVFHLLKSIDITKVTKKALKLQVTKNSHFLFLQDLLFLILFFVD